MELPLSEMEKFRDNRLKGGWGGFSGLVLEMLNLRSLVCLKVC